MVERFDVAVVGAGLAGLSAAHALRSQRVLLLERELRVGGRVYTLDAPHGVRIDMGACFAFNPGVPPQGAALPAEPAIRERGPLGIEHGGKIVFAETAQECLAQLAFAAEQRLELNAFCRGERDASELAPGVRRVIEVLLQQIHPGSVAEYSAERQRDAVHPWYPDHHAAGNGAAPEAYLARLGDRVSVRLGQRVIRIAESKRDVEIVALQERGGIEARFCCAAVVMATPARVARALLGSSAPQCAHFLEQVRYETYTVVAFLLDAPRLSDFRYVLTPERKLTLVMQQGSADRRYRTLLCYYAGAQATELARLPDVELIASTLAEVSALKLAGFSPEQVRFSATQRWPVAGTVLSDAYARLARQDYAHPTPRVFLAGDYISPEGWGYGMDDAVASGLAAARLLQQAALCPKPQDVAL